jgi:hypothetical protein
MSVDEARMEPMTPEDIPMVPGNVPASNPQRHTPVRKCEFEHPRNSDTTRTETVRHGRGSAVNQTRDMVGPTVRYISLIETTDLLSP